MNNRPTLLVTAPNGSLTLYELATTKVCIGRGAECEIQLETPKISRLHAQIEISQSQISVRDMGSTNGTRLGTLVVGSESQPLNPGDSLFLGDYVLQLTTPVAAASKADSDSALSDTTAQTELAESDLRTLLRTDPTILQTDELQLPALTVVARGTQASITARERGQVHSVQITQLVTTIGRATDCDLVITDPRASKLHAQITQVNGGHLLEDRNSSNGCLINGVRTKTCLLSDGDLIRIGSARLHFSKTNQQSNQSNRDRRPVLLVPGLAGSELWQHETKVWPNLRRMVRLREKALLEEWTQPLTVGSLVREPAVIPGLAKSDSFGGLLRYLQEDLGYQPNVDLLEFPYDWRADISTTAVALEQALQNWRQTQPGQSAPRITIVAHSLGGLVVRMLLRQSAMADAIERCIFLGTPHRGAAVTLAIALGASKSMPIKLAMNRIRKLALELPSFYQLLPSEPIAHFEDGTPFLPLQDPATWLQPQYRNHLERARQVRNALATAPNPQAALTCIFGYQQQTLQQLTLARRDDEITVVAQQQSLSGDGFVSETSAVLEQAEIHPVDQHHGVLFSDPDVLKRLRFELLERP